MVKDMCAEAGLSEKKTNHSLWATAVTALFERSNVPENLIRTRLSTLAIYGPAAPSNFEDLGNKQGARLSGGC